MGNSAQKARIAAMKREIARRGGIVGTMTEIPDDILENFLHEVLECPCCADMENAELDDPFVPRRRGGHDH